VVLVDFFQNLLALMNGNRMRVKAFMSPETKLHIHEITPDMECLLESPCKQHQENVYLEIFGGFVHFKSSGL
jgi:hypothetical protein